MKNQYLIASCIISSIATLIVCQPLKNLQEHQCLNITGHSGIQAIECPYERPIIKVEISYDSSSILKATTTTIKNRRIKLQIQCFQDVKPENYSLFSNINLGDIYDVDFRRCPLPINTSIANIIQRFGNQNIIRFQFTAQETETILPIHLKDLNELRRVQFKNLMFSALSENLFANTIKLQWMDLRYTIANNIPKNIFKPLINLTTLELGGAKLQKLTPGMFSNQKNLKKLNLWGNNLKTLPSLVFDGLTALTHLDLMSNNFATFDSNSFSLLKNLTNINLSGNYLTSLPEGLFEQNHLLSLVKIQANRVDLDTLPNGLFSNLSSLTNLTLRKNGIKILPNYLFKGSKQIEFLVIVENYIEKLPKDIFEHQVNLKQLHLSDNKLTTLDDYLFRNSRKLRMLDLSGNELETLSIFVFHGLNRLEKLNLYNNKLINFEPEVMQPLKNLKEIYLQDNQLNFNFDVYGVGSPLNKLTNIEIINMQNNSIQRMYPDWYTSLPQLKYLDLSYNKITMLNKEDLQFTRPSLKLNLSNNLISTINLNKIRDHDDTYAVPNSIIEIDVNSNPLNCDCKITTFSNLLKNSKLYEPFANHLAFKYDNLKCNEKPNDWPYNLSGRIIAQIKSHELVCPQQMPCPEKCTCWFRSFDNSALVNCSNAELTEVPTLFNVTAKTIQSIELHIENNNIENLPTIAAIGYNQVEELYAQNNSISELKSENIPKSLKLLHLADNNLKAIHITTLAAINRAESIRNISLSRNPWKCTCEDAKFIHFVQSKNKIIKDINQLKCEDGKSIATITSVDICYSDNVLLIVICIVLVLLAIFFSSIIALYYKYQLEFKLWLFRHNLFLSFITEDELDKDKKYDAFISYSHKDESFLIDELIPNLENGTHPFKLCLHMRDWVPGAWIHNQIQNSVEDSRRTIVVLSKNFLESEWGQMEFRTAHTAALTEGRARIVIIIYGDIGDIEKLDSNLKVYLKMNTYVKWGDPWFWNKLRYAMPHPQNVRSLKKKTKELCKISSTDGKLLMKSVSVSSPLMTNINYTS